MDTKLRDIPFSPPDISEGEIEEVVKTLRSGWITTGPKTKEFEKRIAEYIGVNKAVCLNSATSAMELTLRLLGVGPGDEVITSAYTYTSSASVIQHVGAKIVLVDTDPGSYEMDYEKLESTINERTKVIIPVDIGGKLCDYESIFDVVDRKKHLFHANSDMQKLYNRVIVMADSAHAFGAERNNIKSGQIADFTCFSFHAVKNLTTAEGGAVVWRNKDGLDDEHLYKKYMNYSLHGQSKDALSKSKKGAWEYDVLYPAYKCNMTDIMASIGLRQLERYDQLLDRRKQIINRYDDALKQIGLLGMEHFNDYMKSSGHLYLLQLPKVSEQQRNKIITDMAARGITCNVHYKPLPMLTAYKNLGFDIKNFPNAYDMYTSEMTLPLHTSLSDKDVDYVIRILNNIYSTL